MPWLTIVAYHYVRDAVATAFPSIKGLPVADFQGQLDYLQRHYTVVGQQEVAAALAGEGELPPNPVLLTFDDGYVDHFVSVLPMLSQRGLQGLFFPAAKPVREGSVLDVNKVHFVLGAVADSEILVQAVRDAVEENRARFGLHPVDAYWREYARASRFDPAEVTFVKRMLQKGLPEALRRQLLDSLFRTHVSADEAAFAGELYMSPDQLKTLVASGMYVGCHGYAHHWMDRQTPDAQRREITRSLDFLSSIGAPTTD